jgi:uncharacterized membrane protein HdeD (DUF308 family)
MGTDVIRSAYRRAWWGLLLRGLLAIAVGALILWRPMDSIASLGLVIAIWALFMGIVQIVHAIELRSILGRWWVLLLSGLVSAGFGVAALFYYPGLSLAFAVVWTSWWLLLTGAFAIFAATWERSVGLSWIWTLAFGILAIAGGVFAFMNPPATLAAIIGLLAGFALASGVLLLIGAFGLAAAVRA